MSEKSLSPLGKVPECWSLVKLKDVAEKVKSGATPKGGDSSYLPRQDRFALIRNQNVFDRRFEETGLAFISGMSMTLTQCLIQDFFTSIHPKIILSGQVDNQWFGEIGTMNQCPNCQCLANPARLLIMTRRHPYRCGKCGVTSLLRPRDNNVAALITGAGLIICVGIGMPSFGLVRAAIIGGLYFVFVVGGTMWCFMRLQSVANTHEK